MGSVGGGSNTKLCTGSASHLPSQPTPSSQPSEQESNSSPDHGALLAQLLLTWEGSVGARGRILSQDHNTPSHRALDAPHSH